MITLEQIFEFVGDGVVALIDGNILECIYTCTTFKDAKYILDKTYPGEFTIYLSNINKDNCLFDRDRYNSEINALIKEFRNDKNYKKFHNSLLLYYNCDKYIYNTETKEVESRGMYLEIGSTVYDAHYFSIPSILNPEINAVERATLIKTDNVDYFYYILDHTYNPFTEDVDYRIFYGDYREMEAVAIPYRKRRFGYRTIGEPDALRVYNEYTIIDRKALSKKKREIVEYLDGIDNTFYYNQWDATDKLTEKFFKKGE